MDPAWKARVGASQILSGAGVVVIKRLASGRLRVFVPLSRANQSVLEHGNIALKYAKTVGIAELSS